MGGREDSHEDGGAYGERLAACALAEGGAVGRGWRRVNLGGRCHEGEREKERERVLQSCACLYFVEEMGLIPLVGLGGRGYGVRLAWSDVMGLLGLVDWELIPISTELICV
jgi:hypothetical protein